MFLCLSLSLYLKHKLLTPVSYAYYCIEVCVCFFHDRRHDRFKINWMRFMIHLTVFSISSIKNWGRLVIFILYLHYIMQDNALFYIFNWKLTHGIIDCRFFYSLPPGSIRGGKAWRTHNMRIIFIWIYKCGPYNFFLNKSGFKCRQDRSRILTSSFTCTRKWENKINIHERERKGHLTKLE